MKTFYVVFCGVDDTDEQAMFISAPSESVAIKSLGDFVEIIEILEFDEDEAFEFGLDITGGDNDEYRELDFDRDY